MKLARLALVVVALALGCREAPVHSRVGVAVVPPPGRVVGFDPSAVGLPGAIADTVYDSAGVVSWIKYGTSNTAWRPVPVSQMVTGDPSQSPGLKAPIGFQVTMFDGSASWSKTTTSDTGWTPSGGTTYTAGTGIAIDGGGHREHERRVRLGHFCPAEQRRRDSGYRRRAEDDADFDRAWV